MMKKLPYQWFIGGMILLLLVLIPWLTSSRYFLHILILILYFGYLATCWNILGGYAGLNSFGNSVFVGVGAYTSTLLFINIGLSPWIGMWIGGLAAGLVGLIFGYLSFRYGLKGPYFLLVTIAFGEVFVYLALNIKAVGAGSGLNVPLMGEAPTVFQFQGKTPYYYVMMIMVIMIVGICYAIKNSRMGYYFHALRENEDAAQALGINVMVYKLWATVLSAFFSALGGTFYAQYILYIDASSVLGIGLSIEIVIYAVVGGVGTILGPILGTFLLFPVGEATRSILAGHTGGIHMIVYGAILVMSILLMPKGIIGVITQAQLWRRWRRTLKKRVAEGSQTS
jgi:branched-chain amino acid transport system permease protein